MIEDQRVCPVCDSSEVESLVEIPFTHPASSRKNDTLEVVICLKCQMVFNLVEMRQEAMDMSYRTNRRYARMVSHAGPQESRQEDVLTDAPWDTERLSLTSGFIRRRFDPSVSVLDVGGASGALAGLLTTAGFSDVTVSDPSQEALELAAIRHQVEVIQTSVFDLVDQVDRAYDVIVLSHVVEHLRDARQALTVCRSILGDFGSIVVEVPDARRYCDFLISPYHDFNTEHINHFTEVSLSNLLRSAGFIITAIELDSPASLYPVIRVAAAVSPKTLGGSDASERLFELEHPDLRQSLERYIRDSDEYLKDIVSQIVSRSEANPIAIWGFGELSYKLIPALSNSVPIQFVVDGAADKWGQPVPLLDLQVMPPKAIPSGSHVVISSLHHASSIESALRRSRPDLRPIVLSSCGA